MKDLKTDADFFATGLYMSDGLNFDFIPRVHNDKQSISGGGYYC